MKKIALLLVLALAACASSPEPVPPQKQLDYSALGRLGVEAQDIRVINRTYALPQLAAYVGQTTKPTLVDAVNRWVSDRMQAVGSAGHVIVIIKNADVTESKIPHPDSGIGSWFTRQQGSQYLGHIEVTVEAQSPTGGTAIASATASHAVSLPEEPTQAEKYRAYVKLLDSLMVDLNQALEQSIHEHMGAFLVSLAPSQSDTGAPVSGTAPSPVMNAAPVSGVVETPVEATPSAGPREK